jgi:uncharacterized protein (DUF433 family)
VPVDLVVGKLAGGMTSEEVAQEYGISVADIRAALAYAASVLAEQELRVTV